MTDAVGFGRIAATLPVQDMARASQFYLAGLGFHKVFENGSPPGFMILRNEAAELHLTLQPGYQAAPFPVAHLLVADVDALFARCRTLNVRIIKGVQDKEYGLRAFVFCDPCGNRIDVGQTIARDRQAPHG